MPTLELTKPSEEGFAQSVRARQEEVLVQMRDGVRLATDVYVPRSKRGRGQWPSVLVRLPYDKRGVIAFMPLIASFLVERGYAVVIQDVRGKLRSEGQREPFVHETVDGYDTLEWISTRAWSDGAVGMLGDSYYGYTQWAAAASGHRALRAIVPRVTTTRIVDDWFFHDDAFCLSTMVDWAALTWVDERLQSYRRDWSVRPLSHLLPSWLGGDRSSRLEEWMVNPPDARYWSALRAVAPDPSTVDIPVLHLGGWWDVYRRGQLADWRHAVAGSGRHHELMMGATDHLSLELPEDGHGPAHNWMATPSTLQDHMPRYLDASCAFLDRHVRGVDVGRTPTVTYQVGGLGWCSAETWPPGGAHTQVLWLSSGGDALSGPEGGMLSERPSRMARIVRWAHDPSDLVPSLDPDPWASLSYLPDERDVEIREDVATFTSEPMLREQILAGPAGVSLDVTASAAPFQVVAKLVHVFPDGYARRISEGIVQVSRRRDSTHVNIDLGDIAYRVPAGEHLRLEVAASHFPRYLPVLDPGADPWTSEPGPLVGYHLRVGGAALSRLALSTLSSPSARSWSR